MIKKQDVQYIAKLARIRLTAVEIKKFQKELSSILDYFNSLKEVNVSNVKPTFHPTEYFFQEKLGIVREDKTKSQSAEVVKKLVWAAPERERSHIKVKTIL